MKLLDEIVDLLANEQGSLTAALLKTKVLLHTLGHADLAEWVNDELNGYPASKPVPDYRVVHGRLAGNIQSAVLIQGDVDLPTHHLPEEMKAWLAHDELRQTMTVLEKMAGSTALRRPLPPEMYAEIAKAMTSGYWVQSAWVELQSTQIKDSISKVRARLLDFALHLRDKIGDVEEKEVKQVAASTDVSGMFNGAVFGDNALVILGNDNKVKVTNKKGDFDALAKLLTSKGVSDEDVSELKAAIASDEGVVVDPNKSFGPTVKSWMTKMLGKAVDASWQIELGVAGGLLTEALKAYYL